MLHLRYRLKSDEGLMLAYRQGDAGAFECLYHRHKDALFAFLYRHCALAGVVEELAQDTWEAVINAAPRYQPTAKFRTWLFQIGRNRMADYWRGQRPESSTEAMPEEAAAENAGERFDNLERDVLQAVGALPLEQRDAVLLKQQGFSIGEIAHITDSAVETVKSRLRYGRTRLREQLGDSL